MTEAGQVGRSGLGLKPRPATVTRRDQRQAITRFMEDEFEQARFIDNTRLEMQGD